MLLGEGHEARLLRAKVRPVDSGADLASEYAGWSTSLRIHFLETLLSKTTSAPQPPLTSAALGKMDELYGLTSTKNAEVRLRWQRLCLLHRQGFIVPHVLDFVKGVGRMKFVRPLYRELYAWEEQRSLAQSTFLESRSNYHPIAAKMLAQDLKIK